MGYFALPEHCWLENYYSPLEKQFPYFLERHPYSALAAAIVKEEQKETMLYRKFRSYFSYGFYIAKKI
jgi:hypothetical protein